MALNKKKYGIIIGVVVAVCAVVGFKIYQHNTLQSALNGNYIYEGISIDGTDVSLLTKEQATEKISLALTKNLGDETLLVYHNEDEWILPFADLDTEYNITKAVEDVYLVGREGSTSQRTQIIDSLKKNPLDIPINIDYNEKKLDTFIDKLDSEITQAPEDSTLAKVNGKFVATDDKTGYVVNKEETRAKIIATITSGIGGKIEVTVDETPANITKEEMSKTKTLLGTFSTNYTGAETTGRNINLKVACAEINGTILLPGEKFSMNEALGDQTYAKGYREGGVIVNGKIESGLGGGVCQVTTTLYNAAIFSELNIIERQNHSLAVAYVPLGRDAAIAGVWKDLKFENSTDYPIYIEASAENKKVVVNIYGHETRPSSRRVEFETVYLNTIQKPAEKITEDPTKPADFREVTFTGKTGSKVSTYKLVYENDVLVSKDWFSNSTYLATADEVTVGTGTTAEPDTTETDVAQTMTNTNEVTQTIPNPTPETNAAPETNSTPETDSTTTPAEPVADYPQDEPTDLPLSTDELE